MSLKKEQHIRERTLALAGLLQAAQLVDALAMTGHCHEKELATSLNSLFIFDADTVEAIYGGTSHLQHIFPLLKRIFRNRPLKKDRYIVRYFVQIIQLAHELQKNHASQEAMNLALQRINQQVAHLTLLHPCVYESINNAYEQIISPLSPTIQVMGQARYINQKDILHKIRASLLAGIRSAVLWQQLGGKRWHLLLARKPMVRMITTMEKEKPLHGCTS